MIKRLCVFCGSSVGKRPEYSDAARELGALAAQKGIAIVYGGGRTGLMGAVADAALAAGGQVIGVIPEGLATRELKHDGLTELHVVKSMHERKAKMAELADAFVALPGGLGTFEELCEILTWSQLGIHSKACGVLNTAGYFDLLLGLFNHAVNERFVRADDRALVLDANEPVTLFKKINAFCPGTRTRWIGPVES
ncbi:MAG: TIGR00730 family Rossman fold protein [Planctomycetota bacterium]